VNWETAEPAACQEPGRVEIVCWAQTGQTSLSLSNEIPWIGQRSILPARSPRASRLIRSLAPCCGRFASSRAAVAEAITISRARKIMSHLLWIGARATAALGGGGPGALAWTRERAAAEALGFPLEFLRR
jgi:hypothetical protein